MLNNKQIHTLLLENKDMKAFQKFVGFKSYNAMKFRLESEEPKNNLWGMYEDFKVGLRKEAFGDAVCPAWLDSMRVPFAPEE